MASSITEQFYVLGGYRSSSSSPAYIALDVVTGTYVPQAAAYFNNLCSSGHSVSVNYASMSTGNLFDDVIVTELALYFADSAYDLAHVDADSKDPENRHWAKAERLMLNAYGVRERRTGRTVFPNQADDTRAYGALGVATCSY